MNIISKIAGLLSSVSVKYLNSDKNPIKYDSGDGSLYAKRLDYHSSSKSQKSKEQELAERQEMYTDTFIRGIISVFVGRALGATHNNEPPFIVRLREDINLDLSEKVQNEIKKELDYIRDLASSVIYELVKDSEALGDGYCKIEKVEGKGIVNLLYNYSTKPFFITPIISTKRGIVSYQVVDGEIVHKNEVGHVNAPYNGSMQVEHKSDINNMNVWHEEELFYEDFVYGGCLEDMLPKYQKYVWAMKALLNARVASSTIHRFFTHDLASLNTLEAEALKRNFQDQLKASGEAMRAKANTLDPTISTFDMYIPTLGGNGKNTVDIKVETPQLNMSTEDAMLHIKDLVGGIGYHMSFTSFGENSQTGKEEDLNLESHSSRIRKSVSSFVRHLIKVHFIYKFKQDIDVDKIEIIFSEVTNRNKLMKETERLESIANTQQTLGIMQTLIEMKMKNKNVLRRLLGDAVKETPYKVDLIDGMIEEILLQSNASEEQETD